MLEQKYIDELEAHANKCKKTWKHQQEMAEGFKNWNQTNKRKWPDLYARHTSALYELTQIQEIFKLLDLEFSFKVSED